MGKVRTDRPQPITFNRYNLKTQLAQLQADVPLQTHGRESLRLLKDSTLDLVLVSLKAKAFLPEHKAPGVITVLVLEGRIVFTALGERLELGVHGLVTLPARVLHTVEALEDSSMLMTILAPFAYPEPIELANKSSAMYST